MRPPRFPRPSPALVVACIALLVALGGTGYAASVLPRASVGTIQLKNGAVTSLKVRNGSLALVDIRATERAKLKGAPGAPGPKGDRGDKGDKGDKGDVGLAAREFVEGANVTLPVNNTAFASVSCPAGKQVIGGGGHVFGAVAGAGYLWHSIPTSPTTWRVGYKNTTASNATIRAWAVCAVIAP